MVTHINVVDEGKTSEIEGNAQVIDKVLNVEQIACDNPRLGLALRVSNALQTTLDIEQLISLFSKRISPALPHEGISYCNDRLGIVIQLNRKKSKHLCTYRVLLNDEPMGDITLRRSWEFSNEETNIFEYTLCNLIYPLRNAILYREAVLAAHKDPLTGVNNRATFDETIIRETRLARRYHRPLSLIILDIDHFKLINDELGHSMGDCVIKSTAECTASCIRSTDILFRYGGEEFVIMLSNTSAEGASQLAERIRRAIERSKTGCGAESRSVTVSLGVSTLSHDESEKEFFSRADAALLEAKRSGRNRVCIAEQLEKTQA
ncbi:MAG: GGDEF domain-containing protein [Gammaproteobacteria bacterium]|nr:GGDEF domain-containing protein [Gammaproteobacteria bacterium]